jgi:hypothetical protein
VDEREWIARYIERMAELYWLSPELGHCPSEVRRFAYESAKGAYSSLKDDDPVDVASAEFIEARSNTAFLEAY